MEYTHEPVLLQECLDGLDIRPDGVYVDGTLGRAGHSLEIVRRLTTGRLIAIDRDGAALDAAPARLEGHMDKVTLVRGNFGDLPVILADLRVDAVDGMLFDFGVSSPQLDDGSRGFSYLQDAPLDMRMDQSAPLTAWEVVNGWSQEGLKRILWQYGEERYSGQIAAAIVRERERAPIDTTGQLSELIRSVMPAKARREKQHPAKRSFQAIRIAVNDELTAAEKVGAGRAGCGRTVGDHLVPFVGGPSGEDCFRGLGERLYLSAGFPCVRLWQDPESALDRQAAHHGWR